MYTVTYRKLALLVIGCLALAGLQVDGRGLVNAAASPAVVTSLARTAPATPQNHTLSGTITDGSSGLGLLARLTATSGPQLFNLTTNPNGTYSISLLDGVYTIQIQAGYCRLPAFRTVDLTSADRTLNVALAPVLDSQGFGYSCEDLVAPTWIPGTSAAMRFTPGTDQFSITLPFNFSFYGQPVTGNTVWATRNGYATLGQQSAIVENHVAIPNASAPNNVLYTYWDQFDTTTHGSLYTATTGAAPNRKFVIEWRDMALYTDPNPLNPTTLNFEIIFYETSSQFDFQYLHTGPTNEGHAAHATIGIENSSGTGALQYLFNQPVLQDNTLVHFYQPPIGILQGHVTDRYSSQPLHAHVCASGEYLCTFTDPTSGFYSLHLVAGTYTVQVTAPKHFTATATVQIVANQTTTQDFQLDSAHVLYAPTPVSVTLPPNTVSTSTLVLNNTGPGTLQYRLREATGPQPVGCGTLAPGDGPQGTTTVEQVWPATRPGARPPSISHFTPAQDSTRAPLVQPGPILVFADDPYHTPTYPERALAVLGWSATVVFDNAAGFDDQLLHHGPWSLVIITDEYNTTLPTYFEDIRAYMNGGGRTVFMTFNYENDLGPPTTLFDTLGIQQPVNVNTNIVNPQVVWQWEPSEFIFRCPAVITQSLTMRAPSPPPGDYGNRLIANSQGLEWGGFAIDPTVGNAAIVGRDDGRAVSAGFTISTLTDVNGTTQRPYGVDLLVNMIKYVGNPPIAWGDVPWLSEAPTDGIVTGTTQLPDILTFNTNGLSAGNYTGYLFGLTNDPNAYRTQIQVNLTVCNPCHTGDLSVVGLRPRGAHPGPGLNWVDVDVKNVGDQPITASNYLYVDLFVDLGHTPGPTDPSQGFASITQAIPPGQIVTVGISWNAATARMHDFYAWVNRDCLAQVGEIGCSSTSPGNNLFGPIYGCTYSSTNGNTFTDVQPNTGDPHYSAFYSYIEYMACLGAISGYSSSPPCLSGTPCFLPANNTTRGQFTKILANALQWSDAIPSTRQTFRDVPFGSTYWIYIERAVVRNAISGYTSSPPCPAGQAPCFLPGNNITRGQIAKVVSNAKGWNDTIPSTQQTFMDVPLTSTYWLYVERAHVHNIISGYTASPPCPAGQVPCFLPANSANRGQLSKMVTLAVQQP